MLENGSGIDWAQVELDRAHATSKYLGKWVRLLPSRDFVDARPLVGCMGIVQGLYPNTVEQFALVNFPGSTMAMPYIFNVEHLLVCHD